GELPGAPEPPKQETWEQKVSRIRWVAYSPSTGDPTRTLEPKPEEVKEDLALLRKAGFDGLVTYGATGFLGKDFPALAQAEGFEGLILGIWDIKSKVELDAAKEAAKSSLALGLCAGNEGYPKRYGVEDLKVVIRDLQQATGKPVTTTEEI